MNNESNNESGNVLIIILLAVALIGALSVAIQGSSKQKSHIDDETVILRISEAQRYASELGSGIAFIMQNGISESDIRFSHPNAHTDYGDLGADADKSDQMFHRDGGAAKYRTPPEGVNDGSAWEFYGHSALPYVGSDAADLMALLPNVTQKFCEKANAIIGYDATQPTDSATCLYGGDTVRFNNLVQFSAVPNTVNDATFSLKPSMQGCVQCAADNSYHFFYVLIAR